MQAVAIAFDVKDSRAFKDKEALLQQLRELSEVLNARHPDFLVPFQIKSGDSLLGVYPEYAVAYSIALELLHQPIDGYIGIGFGQYETPSAQSAEEANGSALVHAFEAEREAKKQGKRLFFAGPPYFPAPLLNGYFDMLYPDYFGKTERQVELHRLMDRYPDETYEQIGVRMGFPEKDARANVAKLVSRSNRKQRMRLEEALVRSLEQLQRWEAIG